jgi:hypothetical protein
LLYMVCCVFQATNLVNNYGQRKSARTFVSKQEASNKLYTVLATGFILVYLIYLILFQFLNSEHLILVDIFLCFPQSFFLLKEKFQALI